MICLPGDPYPAQLFTLVQKSEPVLHRTPSSCTKFSLAYWAQLWPCAWFPLYVNCMTTPSNIQIVLLDISGFEYQQNHMYSQVEYSWLLFHLASLITSISHRMHSVYLTTDYFHRNYTIHEVLGTINELLARFPKMSIHLPFKFRHVIRLRSTQLGVISCFRSPVFEVSGLRSFSFDEHTEFVIQLMHTLLLVLGLVFGFQSSWLLVGVGRSKIAKIKDRGTLENWKTFAKKDIFEVILNMRLQCVSKKEALWESRRIALVRGVNNVILLLGPMLARTLMAP